MARSKTLAVTAKMQNGSQGLYAEARADADYTASYTSHHCVRTGSSTKDMSVVL